MNSSKRLRSELLKTASIHLNIIHSLFHSLATTHSVEAGSKLILSNDENPLLKKLVYVAQVCFVIVPSEIISLGYNGNTETG